jgi:hypothetical protein
VLILYVAGRARTTKTGAGAHKDIGGKPQGPGETVESSSVPPLQKSLLQIFLTV